MGSGNGPAVQRNRPVLVAMEVYDVRYSPRASGRNGSPKSSRHRNKRSESITSFAREGPSDHPSCRCTRHHDLIRVNIEPRGHIFLHSIKIGQLNGLALLVAGRRVHGRPRLTLGFHRDKRDTQFVSDLAQTRIANDAERRSLIAVCKD